MALIVRFLLIAAAPITALFVARDAVNFSIMQTFTAIIMIVGFAVIAAGWSLRRQQ